MKRLSLLMIILLACLGLGCTSEQAEESGSDNGQAVAKTETAKAESTPAPTPTATPKPEKIVLKYANFPPASTFPCVQMERWKEEVEKRTNGQVEVQTFPGSTLLGAKNMVDGVIAGTADVGNFAMSYQPGRFPVSEAVDLPIGFPDAMTATLTLNELIQEYQPKEFEGVKLLCLFTCPPSNFMTAEPVRSLKDLEGLQVRVSGTGVDMVKRLGGNPVAMPMSETPDAIQKGMVKGIVSSMEILKDFNFSAYCPYATHTNLHVVTFAVVMNEEKWNSLPPATQKVLDDLSMEQAKWTAEYVDQHVEDALVWAKEKYDHELIELPAEEQAKIPAMMQPIVDAYIERVTKEGLPGQEIVDKVKAMKAKFAAQP